MTVGIEIDLPAQTVNFPGVMRGKRADAAGHDVDDRVRNGVLADVFAAFGQCLDVVVDRLRGAQLFRDGDFEAAGVVIGKLHRSPFGIPNDIRYALGLGFIHAAVAVSLAGHVIFQLRMRLMIFRQFVDERLIAAVGSEALRAHKKNVLYIIHQ